MPNHEIAVNGAKLHAFPKDNSSRYKIRKYHALKWRRFIYCKANWFRTFQKYSLFRRLKISLQWYSFLHCTRSYKSKNYSHKWYLVTWSSHVCVPIRKTSFSWKFNKWNIFKRSLQRSNDFLRSKTWSFVKRSKRFAKLDS